MDILTIHNRLKAKELSPIELTRQCLHKARNSPHNSFISILEDLALDLARKSGREDSKRRAKNLSRRNPLHFKRSLYY